MGIDEVGIDKVGIDEVGRYRTVHQDLGVYLHNETRQNRGDSPVHPLGL